MKSTKLIIGLLAIALIALIGGISIHSFGVLKTQGNQRRINSGNNYNQKNGNGYGYGMMGGSQGYGNGGYNMMGGSQGYGMMNGFSGNGNNVLNENQVQKDINDSLKNAKIDKSNNTITYSGQNIKIVMLGGPKEADGKFVIDGMINPTLYVPKGTGITIEFVNEDEGMPHGIEITNEQPPYPYMVMMQGQIYPGTLINPLEEAKDNSFAEAETTFNADYAGQFYYICQYPGHAQKGMYGKIIIE